MTSPSETSQKSDTDVFRLVAVRRRDVPTRDGQYPSPRRLRRAIAFAIDIVLHVGGAVAAFFAIKALPQLSGLTDLVGLWAILTFLALSTIDRIVLQRISGTTVGKALFGLCLVRRADGGWPTIGQLIRQWLTGVLAVASALAV